MPAVFWTLLVSVKYLVDTKWWCVDDGNDDIIAAAAADDDDDAAGWSLSQYQVRVYPGRVHTDIWVYISDGDVGPDAA